MQPISSEWAGLVGGGTVAHIGKADLGWSNMVLKTDSFANG